MDRRRLADGSEDTIDGIMISSGTKDLDRHIVALVGQIYHGVLLAWCLGESATDRARAR